MNADDLVSTYPVVYHITAAGSWRAIRENGLWTVEDIVTTAQCGQQEADTILHRRRPRAVRLVHPVLGEVCIRDQSPLRPDVLARCLTDLSPAQWLALLNNRVFFWLDLSRLKSLLSGRRNRNDQHDVIVVDTASLVSAHRRRIRLSAINSGATLYPNAPWRGSHTFQTIASYPYAERRRSHPVRSAIAELAVIGGVHDLADHVIGLQRWKGPQFIANVDIDATATALFADRH